MEPTKIDITLTKAERFGIQKIERGETKLGAQSVAESLQEKGLIKETNAGLVLTPLGRKICDELPPRKIKVVRHG